MRDWNDTQTAPFVVAGSDGTHADEKTRARIYGININSNEADIDM